MEYYGIEYLKNKLNSKRVRVLKRYQYYESKDELLRLSDTMPERLKLMYRSVSGWCARAVDALADRLIFREISGEDGDVFGLNDIFTLSNGDELFDNAILSALIASCCFIYVSKGEDVFPRLQVIDGGNATGIKDEITGMLSEGYAVLERDNNNGKPLLEAYFTAEATYITDTKTGKTDRYSNPSGFPLLAPIIYRADAMRPFGHSRISRTCMYLQQYAKRTLERSEVSAEFYSFPQKYVLGLSDKAEQMDNYRATMSAMLRFDKDDDGDRPTVGQFQQQSMQPYLDQLRTAASAFAGETGLTVDDLGFVADNPSSSDAIKASHESLRLTARKAQRSFSRGFINAGFLAACVRDNFAYRPDQFYKLKVKWEPIFEPDAAMLAAIGDGAFKINQAVPDYFTAETFRDLTGI